MNSHTQKSTAPSRQRVCHSTTWARPLMLGIHHVRRQAVEGRTRTARFIGWDGFESRRPLAQRRDCIVESGAAQMSSGPPICAAGVRSRRRLEKAKSYRRLVESDTRSAERRTFVSLGGCPSRPMLEDAFAPVLSHPALVRRRLIAYIHAVSVTTVVRPAPSTSLNRQPPRRQSCTI